jgi:hypothetical protein
VRYWARTRPLIGCFSQPRGNLGGNRTNTPGDSPHVESIGVTTARIVGSAIVLGMTLAGSVWLATYKVSVVFEYVEYDFTGTRRHFHPSERVLVPAWWGAWAAVALAVVGLAITVRLAPTGRTRLVRRIAERLAKPIQTDGLNDGSLTR